MKNASLPNHRLGLGFGLGEVSAIIRRDSSGDRLNIRLTASSAVRPPVESDRPRRPGGLGLGDFSAISPLYHAGHPFGIIQLIGIDWSSYPSQARHGVSASPAAATCR